MTIVIGNSSSTNKTTQCGTKSVSSEDALAKSKQLDKMKRNIEDQLMEYAKSRPSKEFDVDERMDAIQLLNELAPEGKKKYGDFEVLLAGGIIKGSPNLIQYSIPGKYFSTGGSIALNLVLDENNQIKEIKSNLSAKDLACVLKNAPSDLPLLDEIKKHLDLPEVSDEDAAEFNENMERNQEAIKREKKEQEEWSDRLMQQSLRRLEEAMERDVESQGVHWK